MNKMKLLISISFLLLIFLDKNILGFDNPFSGAKNSLLNSEFDNQEPNDYESFEQEDLIVIWENEGQETKRLFSYCINREDVENAILQGP